MIVLSIQMTTCTPPFYGRARMCNIWAFCVGPKWGCPQVPWGAHLNQPIWISHLIWEGLSVGVKWETYIKPHLWPILMRDIPGCVCFLSSVLFIHLKSNHNKNDHVYYHVLDYNRILTWPSDRLDHYISLNIMWRKLMWTRWPPHLSGPWRQSRKLRTQ